MKESILQCDCCGKVMPEHILYNLTANGKTDRFCPNCSSIMIQNGQMEKILKNDELFADEATGKKGAIRFTSGNESYYLKRSRMIRLLNFSLKPREWKSLKQDEFQYMLHDDFYTKDGICIQPVSFKYVAPLTKEEVRENWNKRAMYIQWHDKSTSMCQDNGYLLEDVLKFMDEGNLVFFD